MNFFCCFVLSKAPLQSPTWPKCEFLFCFVFFYFLFTQLVIDNKILFSVFPIFSSSTIHFFLHTQQKKFTSAVFSSLFFVTLENFHEFLWSVRHHLHVHCTDDDDSSMESDANEISKFCT